jgi:hypothetical protein
MEPSSFPSQQLSSSTRFCHIPECRLFLDLACWERPQPQPSFLALHRAAKLRPRHPRDPDRIASSVASNYAFVNRGKISFRKITYASLDSVLSSGCTHLACHERSFGMSQRMFIGLLAFVVLAMLLNAWVQGIPLADRW